MCIFNGKAGQNYMMGKATTVYNTMLDYVIGSPHLLTRIKNFKAMDFDPLLSVVFNSNFRLRITWIR